MTTTVLILGERSNRPNEEGYDEVILSSTTVTRLDWCFKSWREAFVVRNVWDSKSDDRDGRERVLELLLESNPSIVVALGITVSMMLGQLQDVAWLAETEQNVEGFGSVKVVKFPHPSGRSRFWNNLELSEQARKTLTQLAEGSARVPQQTQRVVTSPQPTSQAEQLTSHEITIREFKVSKESVATCSCGYSVAGRAKQTVEDEAAWHIEQKTKKVKIK